MEGLLELRELWDLLLKVTLLFGVAALLDLGLRRVAARVRHALWASAALGALALPWAGPLEGHWGVPIFPGPPGEAVASTPVDSQPVAVTPPPRATTRRTGRTGVAPRPHRELRPSPSAAPAGTVQSRARLPRSSAASEVPAAPVQGSSWSFPPGKWIAAGVWALGALYGLIRFFLGWQAARGLSSRASRWSPDRRVPLHELVQRSGLRHAPTMKLSAEIASPLTFGWRAPVVLLPLTARSWSPERLELVLLHELVHIRRRDALIQPFVQFMRIAYWFHPLAHWTHRRISLERERACDEEVIQLGARPSTYASHLLDLALARPPRGVLSHATLGMAHKTQLEGRLMPLLEDARRHRRGLVLLPPLTLAMGMTVLTLAACKTWSLARPVEVDPQEALAHREQVQAQETAAPERQETAEPAADPVATPAARIPVAVPDPEPVPGPQEKGRMSFVHMRGFEGFKEETLRIRGHGWMDGDESNLPPLLRNNSAINRLLAELAPSLLEMEPAYAQLDAIHAEMEPIHEKMESVHEQMEPYHERLSELHLEMEPFHERIGEIHESMNPLHELLDSEHEHLQPFHEQMEAIHEEMAPLHEVMERIHEEMGPFHEQMGHLHEELNPFSEQSEEVRREMELYRDRRDEIEDGIRTLELERRAIERDVRSMERRLRRLTENHPDHASLKNRIREREREIDALEDRAAPLERKRDELDQELDPFRERLELLDRQREPVMERLHRIHEEMEPFHQRLSSLHESMEPFHQRLSKLHEGMEPFHERIAELHENFRPNQGALDELHRQMEPFRGRMAELHEQMEPIRELLDPIHEKLAPFHERMDPIHEQLDPLWERIEPTLDQLSKEIAADVALLLQDKIREAGPYDDERLVDLMREAGEELGSDLDWSWSLSRTPIQLRLQGETAKNIARLERRLEAWEARTATALGSADRGRLTGALRSFARAIPTLRYGANEPR